MTVSNGEMWNCRTQISANISAAARDRLERYVRSRGLKTGPVIEQALLHHLEAVAELPDEVVVPPRLVVTRDAGERVLERPAAHEAPNDALRALSDGAALGDDP